MEIVYAGPKENAFKCPFVSHISVVRSDFLHDEFLLKAEIWYSKVTKLNA